MARRKPASLVGPFGVWAYDTRDLLNLSVEEVIDRLPTKYNSATLRKVEGGSSKPGRRMWRELQGLYQVEAEAAGVTIRPQPPLVEDEPGVAESDLAAAIRGQTAMMAELVAVLRPAPPVVRANVAPAPTVRKRRSHWLRLARDRRGWTIADVDRKLERANVYGRWESGDTSPRGAEVARLAQALDVPEWIITNPPATDEERLALWHYGDQEGPAARLEQIG